MNILPLCKVANMDEDIYSACKILISKFQKRLFANTLDGFQDALEGILAPVFHVHTHLQKKSDEL